MLGYIAFLILSFLLPLIPSRIGYHVASFAGDLSYYLLPRPRRHVFKNLRPVLGPEVDDCQLRATARAIFRTGALNYYDLFRIPRLDLKKIAELITVDGWENLAGALRGGKGAVLVAPHLGNLDILGQLAIIRSVPCAIPTERVRNTRLLELVTRLRASRGLVVVPLDGTPAPMRTLYQMLHQNGVLAIVADRDVQGNGLPIRFFGEETAFPSGPVAIALRTGAPLLAARPLRRGRGYHIEFTPVLDLPRTGDMKRDVREGTALMAALFERFIRETPSQWVVFEPVWSAIRPRGQMGKVLEVGSGA